MHKIHDDQRHLHDKFPICIFLGASLLFFRAVFVPAFVDFTVFLYPSHRFLKFFGVVNTFVHPAQNLYFVHAFVSHAEVFLKEVVVYDRTGDTHRHAADRKVRFSSQLGDCYGALGETE